MRMIHLPTNRIFNIISSVFPNTIRLQRTDIINTELHVSQIVDIDSETLRDLILKGFWFREIDT